MYLRYAIMAPISLAVNLAVILTSPIWAAWAAIANIDRLPGVFALLHTHDDSIYGEALAGPKPAKVVDRFKRAVWWIARNPSYGFDSYVLGIPYAGLTFIYDTGPTTPFDKPRTASRFYIMKTAKGRKYFGYRRDQMLWGKRYIKIWFGHHFEPKGPEPKHLMIKIMCNPFKTMK